MICLFFLTILWSVVVTLMHIPFSHFPLQIVLHSCPKKLRELLKYGEVPPAGQCPALIITFAENSTVSVEDVRLCSDLVQ